MPDRNGLLGNSSPNHHSYGATEGEYRATSTGDELPPDVAVKVGEKITSDIPTFYVEAQLEMLDFGYIILIWFIWLQSHKIPKKP